MAQDDEVRSGESWSCRVEIPRIIFGVRCLRTTAANQRRAGCCGQRTIQAQAEPEAAPTALNCREGNALLCFLERLLRPVMMPG